MHPHRHRTALLRAHGARTCPRDLYMIRPTVTSLSRTSSSPVLSLRSAALKLLLAYGDETPLVTVECAGVPEDCLSRDAALSH